MTRSIIVTPFLLEPVDALIVVVVATSWVFVLYVLAMAVVNISRVLRQLAPPLVRPIFDWLTGQATAIENWAHEQAAERLLPVTHLFRHIDNRLRRYLEAQTGAHGRALAAIRRVRFDVIPRVQNALITFVQERIAAVIAHTNAVAAQLHARITAVSAAQTAYTQAVAQQLQRQLAQTRAELLADDRALLTYTQQLVTQAMVRADQEIARAIRALQLDDQLVITYAQSLATQSQAYTRSLVTNEQQQRLAQGNELQREIATTATAVISLILPQIATLARRIKSIEDSPCQQECQTLGQLGSNLDGLDLAALLALLIGAAEHPHEAAPVVRSLLTPGSQLVSGELLGLLGGRR
jgi:hypothetical protein